MSITAVPDLTLPAKDRLPEQGIVNKLNPIELSAEEKAFLLEHLEERPAKALMGWDRSIPHAPEPEHGPKMSVNPWRVSHPGIVPEGIERILARIRDIEDTTPENLGYYKRDRGMAPLIGREPEKEYYGLEAIRTAIEDCQIYEQRLNEIRRQEPDAALHPSMHTIDARNRLHWQGVGSDRGMVRRFTCELFHDTRRKIAPDWMTAAARESNIVPESEIAEKSEGQGGDFRIIEGDNYFECPVKGCNKRIDFDPNDEGARRRAFGAMAPHMTNTKKQVDDHREAKVVNFG